MPLHRKPTSTFIVLSIICFFGCDPLEIFLHRGLSMWIKFSQLRLSWIFLLVCRFPCLHPSFCFWAIPYFSIGCPLAMFSISFCSTRKGLLLSRLWLLTTEMELGTILGTGPQGFGDVGFRLSQEGELGDICMHLYPWMSPHGTICTCSELHPGPPDFLSSDLYFLDYPGLILHCSLTHAHTEELNLPVTVFCICLSPSHVCV